MTIESDKLEAVTAAHTLTEALQAVCSVLIHGTTNRTSQPPRHVHLSALATSVADYAWGGLCPRGIEQVIDDLHEFSTAHELLSGNFMLPDGTELLSAQSKEAMHRLANAADTRRALDDGNPVRIEGLAALAGVAEKTVRASTNPKSAHPLRVTKDGHWTLIEAPEALTWLGRRNDFRPTHTSAEKGPGHPPLTDTSVLARVCRQWREIQGISAAELLGELSMTEKEGRAYQRLESDQVADDADLLTPSLLHKLAVRLRMPDPRDFARQAYRLVAMKSADFRSDAELQP